MRFKIFTLIICFVLGVGSTIMAQTFNQNQLFDGYSVSNDTIYFIYNSNTYQTQPNNVAITGAFRNWDQNMADTNWTLKKVSSHNWVLKIYNPNYIRIKPNTPFKYRINNGEWQNPPTKANNAKQGNLIFMLGVEPTNLKASITSDAKIVATLTGVDTTVSYIPHPSNFILTDALGNSIKIKTVESDQSNKQTKYKNITLLLEPSMPIDKRRIYYLEDKLLHIKTLVSFNEWFKTLKSDKELGANIINKKQTVFRVFAPRATQVNLYLYKKANDKVAFDTLKLLVDHNGVWETTINKNLAGIWYDYTVHGFTDPGNFFYETNPVHISDPYARVSDDSFGKCMVTPATKPAMPLKGGRPPLQNVIAYEVHIQDFTDGLPVSDNLKGTIPAMAIPNLKNSLGKPIGFDYLCNLGINTVHLMPVQEMLHWPKDEWENAFKNDPYMKEQGVATENYDWGYRTSHSFAIESRYRQKNTKPGDERTQLRDLVQAFHNKGIAVIVDLVFNHTAENMDGREYLFHFNAFDKQYYYRTKNLEHIGEYGNETKSEDRYFVQRWIIDQCKHLINEFGVDGFRIDLAGQTDKQTLMALKEALPKDIIIYGEPWIDSNDPDYNNNPNWHWYKEDSPICYFNDDTRNTYKGPVFDLVNPKLDRGWVGGNSALKNDVIKSLTCNWPTQKNINSAINYLDIHDNYALADQFALYNWDGRFGVDEQALLHAATLLFTTPGPLVLHGGTEFMRSKGIAPLQEIVKEIPSGKLYFHGKRDTYNLRKANEFIWENIGKIGPDSINFKPELDTNLQPYQNSNFLKVNNYFKLLINLRKDYLQPIFTANFNNGIEPKNYFKFMPEENNHILIYEIANKVFVAINTDTANYNITIDDMDKWKLHAINMSAKSSLNTNSITNNGKKQLVITLPANSSIVMVSKD